MASYNRTYSVTGTSQTLTAACYAWFVNPKATGPGAALEIISIELTQNGTATSAMERIQLVTQASVFPTMLAATITPLKFGDPASGITSGTAGAAGTVGIAGTAAGAGTKTAIMSWAFNNLNGFSRYFLPEERPTIGIAATAQGLGLWFPAGPATLTGWSINMVYAELI